MTDRPESVVLEPPRPLPPPVPRPPRPPSARPRPLSAAPPLRPGAVTAPPHVATTRVEPLNRQLSPPESWNAPLSKLSSSRGSAPWEGARPRDPREAESLGRRCLSRGATRASAGAAPSTTGRPRRETCIRFSSIGPGSIVTVREDPRARPAGVEVSDLTGIASGSHPAPPGPRRTGRLSAAR